MQFSRITQKKSHLYASQDYSQNPPCTAAGARPLHAIVQYSHFFLMYSKLYLMAKAFIVLNNLVSHIYIYMHLYNVYIYIQMQPLLLQFI